MMKFKYFLVVWLIFFIGMVSCTKSDKSSEKIKKEKGKKTVEKVKKPVKKVSLLIADGKTYYESDFNEFLEDNLGKNYKELNLSPKVIRSLFNQFVEEIILYTYAKKVGIEIRLTEIKYYLKKNKIDTNIKDIKQTLIRKLFIEKLFSRELSKLKVTDAEAKTYYFKNLKLFRRPAEISLSQIVVNNEKEALKIKAQLEKNISLFAQLARKYSKGPQAKKGGDMGFFSKGELPKDIEKVVFSLNPGEISQVVKSPYGYHIFMVKKRKRKRLLAFKNVVDLIKLRIKEEKSKEILKRIKKEAKSSVALTIINNKYTETKKPSSKNTTTKQKENK